MIKSVVILLAVAVCYTSAGPLAEEGNFDFKFKLFGVGNLYLKKIKIFYQN